MSGGSGQQHNPKEGGAKRSVGDRPILPNMKNPLPKSEAGWGSLNEVRRCLSAAAEKQQAAQGNANQHQRAGFGDGDGFQGRAQAEFVESHELVGVCD